MGQEIGFQCFEAIKEGDGLSLLSVRVLPGTHTQQARVRPRPGRARIPLMLCAVGIEETWKFWTEPRRPLRDGTQIGLCQ